MSIVFRKELHVFEEENEEFTYAGPNSHWVAELDQAWHGETIDDFSKLGTISIRRTGETVDEAVANLETALEKQGVRVYGHDPRKNHRRLT